MSGPHRVVFYWEEGPEARVECPFDPSDLDRPCLIRDGDYGDEGEPMPDKGCAVIEWLDAGGYEAVGVDGMIEAVALVHVSWAGDGYPVLNPASG